ncbi:hypothetical protein V6C53_00440 [Desulfocurvibacter africanus]|uniref:HD domain-containing protein n=1 Tax=Desulfocurvibacter africanus TaxID=873 RepID=UPI002FD9AAF0
MYTQANERKVFKESLRYMIKASEYAHALHMTDHGPLHAQRVYAICRWLGTLFSLTDYESAILQAAALLHDIGMASTDRANHNIESEKLIISNAETGSLPFSKDEALLIGKLCRWHRGDDYKRDCIEFCEGSEVRVGLLASILRLSDELDLDYRRTYFNSSEDMEITKKYKTDQIQYHESVLSILGVRVRADKLSKCFELLIDNIAGAKLQIERLIKEILGTPLPFPIKILPTKKELVDPPSFGTPRKALICAYCNPHGIVTAVLSRISLKLAGIEAEIVCNKDKTASAGAFWNEIKSLPLANYELAYFIDLHIESRNIEPIKEILSINHNCKVFISGATLTSSPYVKELIEYGATVLLGDEHVLFYADFLTQNMPFWIRVAGTCNVDNHVVQKIGNKDVYHTTTGIKYLLFKHFKDNDDTIINTIIENIENNNIQYFMDTSHKFDEEISSLPIYFEKFGRVLLIKYNKDLKGRFIYEWVIDAIMLNKCLPYEEFEFTTPYAIYPIHSLDGKPLRVLYLSYFKNSNKTLPIKCFCNKLLTSVGNDNTIWNTYTSKEEALSDINEVIKRINMEYGIETPEVVNI